MRFRPKSVRASHTPFRRCRQVGIPIGQPVLDCLDVNAYLLSVGFRQAEEPIPHRLVAGTLLQVEPRAHPLLVVAHVPPTVQCTVDGTAASREAPSLPLELTARGSHIDEPKGPGNPKTTGRIKWRRGRRTERSEVTRFTRVAPRSGARTRVRLRSSAGYKESARLSQRTGHYNGAGGSRTRVRESIHRNVYVRVPPFCISRPISRPANSLSRTSSAFSHPRSAERLPRTSPIQATLPAPPRGPAAKETGSVRVTYAANAS
jgi:hypothetical protein